MPIPARVRAKRSEPRVLLGILVGREMYGYELVGELRRRSRRGLRLAEGTVFLGPPQTTSEGYPCAAQWVAAADGPRRRYFTRRRRPARSPCRRCDAWRRS